MPIVDCPFSLISMSPYVVDGDAFQVRGLRRVRAGGREGREGGQCEQTVQGRCDTAVRIDSSHHYQEREGGK